MGSQREQSGTQSIEQRDVQIVYEITPGERCILTNRSEHLEIKDARIQYAADEVDCEMTIEAKDVRDGRYMITHNRCEGDVCPGHVFADFDAIPTIHAVTDDGFVIEVYLDDRDAIGPLTSALRDCSEEVLVHRIKQNSEGRLPEELNEVDLSVLTSKQREALESAIAADYYDTDADVTLAELAAPMDISRQAFSQRLAAAEQKVMSQLTL